MTSRSGEMEMILATSYNGGGGGSVKESTNTEFDPNLPAAYATVDTLQQAHAQYHSRQVKNPETPGTDKTEKNESGYQYCTSVPSDPDVTRGKAVDGEGEEGGSGGGVVRESAPTPPSSHRPRLEAKNLLYEDSELPPERLKHRGIHAGTYSRSGYQEVGGASSWGSYVTCRCQTRTLIITFFIAMAILLSVASLVLSSLLWFGIYGSNSSSSSSSSSSSPSPTTAATTAAPTASSTASSTPHVCNCPSKAETDAVWAELSSIQMMFEELKNYTATAQLHEQLSLIESGLATLDNMTETLARRKSRKITVAKVDVLEPCEPRDVATCDVLDLPADDIQSPCLTDGVAVDKAGEFLVDALCAISGDPIPANETIVASLETFHHEGHLLMRCRCSRLLEHPSQTHTVGDHHVCVLRETRCPMTTDVNVTVDWEQ